MSVKSKKVKRTFPSTLRVYVGPKLAAQSTRNHTEKCVFAQALNKKYGNLGKINVVYGEVDVNVKKRKKDFWGCPYYTEVVAARYSGNARQVKAEKQFENTGKVKAGHYSFRLVK